MSQGQRERPQPPTRTVLPWRLCLLIGSLLPAAAGCQEPLKPVFEPHDPPIVWPAPPATARICYVGQLKTSQDLKPPRKMFEALGDLFVGRKPPDPLYGPRAILRTRDGACLWVADPGGRCLHRFNLQDRTYEKRNTAGAARFLSPVGLCLGPDETFFVCDSEAGAIHRLAASDGHLLQSLRLPDELQRPVAMAYDATTDDLFVVDAAAHNIKVLSADGRLQQIIGHRGDGPGEFNFPCAIALAPETIWIADAGNNRVQGLSPDGRPRITIGQAGDAPGDFALPKALAVDGDGHLYVVDARFENVQIFDAAGRLLLFWGQEGVGPGEFWLPSGIFIDPTDRIWICDSYNARIQVFDYLSTETETDGDPMDRGLSATTQNTGEPR